MTRLTVLMPAYNAAPYIREAIDSVLRQTYHDYELLIINDGSTDTTKDIIESYTDKRIRLVSQENKGIAKALNTGLQLAKGELIARFDADDICLPGRLENQFSFMEANPGCIVTGSEAEFISENGEHLFNFKCFAYTNEEIKKIIYNTCPFIHTAVIYRKSAVLKAGGYPEDAHNFEDHLLWIQLCTYGSYYNLPFPLVKVRYNPASATMDEKWRGSRFRRLKQRILLRGTVTREEGEELEAILEKQDKEKIKKGSYYALCGKKFLLNNHEPGKARQQLIKAIRIYPFRFDNYFLFILSWLPASFLKWLHKMKG